MAIYMHYDNVAGLSKAIMLIIEDAVISLTLAHYVIESLTFLISAAVNKLFLNVT